MKKLILCLLIGSLLLLPGLAQEVTWSPLESSQGDVHFTFRPADPLRDSTFTFFPAPDRPEWHRVSESGSYWVTIRCINEDYRSSVGFKARLLNGKLVGPAFPLQVLVDDYKDKPRPFVLVVECQVKRFETVGAEAEDLGKTAPVTLTLR